MIHSKRTANRLLWGIGFFLAAVLLSLPGSESGTVSALNHDDSPAHSCSITAAFKGSGEVMMTSDNGQVISLEQKTNQIQSPCDQEVTLTAEPAFRWRFDHWQGVPAADRQRPTITVSAPAAVTAVFVPRAVTYEPVETPYYDRSGSLVAQVERLEPLWQPLNANRPAAANAAPVIELWYGDTQNFGQHGTPQEWINVLGNVNDAEGELLNSFSYTLNGGTLRDLSYGGSGSLNDLRRLLNPGDFNIDIDKDDLLPLPGSNEIVITAEDSHGVQTVYTGTVNYDAGTTWNIPYETDWSGAASILDQSQAVDGKWELHDSDGDSVIDGVHPTETGYDRILAIGEGAFAPGDGSQWTEYEATVPVTVHGINEDGFVGNQYAPAFGVVMRWEGHTDTPKTCEQPKCGYLPIGAASWYEWDRDDDTMTKAGSSLWLRSPGNQVKDPNSLQFEFDKRYYWKVRVDNSNGPQGLYHLKTWPAGEAEPNTWHTLEGNDKSLQKGSLLLLAHHVDVTFGDVLVCPLGGCPGPEIAALSVEPAVHDATMTWKTDRLTASRVDYWSDPADVKTITLDTFTKDHAIQLLNLEAETNYEFQIYSVDRFENESTSEIDSFTTEPVPIETFTLTVTTSGAGAVSIDPEKIVYDFGDQVALTAVPAGSKSYFAGWSGDSGSEDNPLVLVINGNTEVLATFTQYVVGDFASYLPTTLAPISNN